MEEQPISVRIYPGDLRPVYYTSLLAFRTTPTLDLIRLSLERLQIFEDKTLYELYEGYHDEEKEHWTKLNDDDTPVIRQEQWKPNDKERRFFLRRKEHASLVLTEIVSQFISPEVDDGQIEDMCNLEELSEQSMLSNLRGRFSNKQIYTYVGSILISVNPYYYYSIYNPKYTTEYVGKPFADLPPHIFATADNAYHSMLNERQSQSVIISGESGAGKTESTKFLLHHLMSLSAKLDESHSLELITLGTGPVLEAFGNAMTVANNNSSRFGKFIQVNFKENGAYQGASIEKYLLEKSRIISQSPGERNYHVFYYLLLGAESELHEQLHLLELDQYQYLTQGCSVSLPNSSEEYHRLRQALTMLSFSSHTQLKMFSVLSAILHIGNISFKKNSEEVATIENTNSLKTISELLEVDERTLLLALTTRKSKAGGTDCIVLPYKVEQAIGTRDSLAKALYGALFDWIVDQVNISLASGGKANNKGYSIGVLDIFGFEVFQKNSFEQFCINFANEQLQQYFNKHIFKLEQDEYESEGIEWSSVSFVDNQDCLDLVAKRPTGLLPLLDEECSFPGADDQTLFQKFERQHKLHPHYRSPQMKQQDPQFTVLHYASEVTYSIKDFREKNRDLMRQDIVDVLRTSRMDLVRALIGLPPYAVHRWHSAYLKVVAGFAFKKAGLEHREKADNRFSSSIPFKFRPGFNSPTNEQKASRSRAGDLATPTLVPQGHDSPDAFPLQYGGKLKIGFGIRASRSYDLLSDATKDDQVDGGDQPLSQSCSSSFLYGSPRLMRKVKPTTRSTSGDSPPNQSPKDLSKEGKSLSESMIGGKSRESPRSRIPSISGLQEKLRKRWPRSLRSKDVPEQHKPLRFWRSAPRVKSSDGPSDPRLLRSVSGRRGPSKTVGGQFQVSLSSLMEKLERTNPFFIRCLKSNGQKAPCQFDNELVLRQLRYTGMMETVKIRKAGYSVRTDFEDFYERYQFLMGAKQADLGQQIKLFLGSLGFSNEDIQIGKTKVFMRDKQKVALQAELGDKVLARIVKIQRWVRAKMLRCRYLHMRRCATTIQCAVRCYLAKRRADLKRNVICKAVLIQAAWRGFVDRRQFIFCKEAAILLQAQWRGLMARRTFAVLLEKSRRRVREEAEQREKAEQEERARQAEEIETQTSSKETNNDLEESYGDCNNFSFIKESSSNRGSAILDIEISDVMFHFDSIINSLDVEPSPSPRPQSPVRPPLDKPGTQSVPTSPFPSTQSAPTSTQSVPTSPCDVAAPELVRLCKPPSPLPKVKQIQKQLLLTKDSEGTRTAAAKPPHVKVNVQDIIRQYRGKRSSPSPEPLPGQSRPRSTSKSIQNKISELTVPAEEQEDHRRAYTPPLVRRKIKSPFLERSKSQDFDFAISDDSQVSNKSSVELPSKSPSPLLDNTTKSTAENSTETFSEPAASPEPVTTPLDSTVHEPSAEDKSTALDTPVRKASTPQASPDKVFITIRDNYTGSTRSLHKKEPVPKKEEQGLLFEDDPVEPASQTNGLDDSFTTVTPSDGLEDRKRSEILVPDDISLNFDSDPPQDGLSSNDSSRVELIIGVRENGLFEAPPRIVDSSLASSLPLPVKKAGHYDRLLSKTHYDHLPPLEGEEDDLEGTMFRYRSVSDVTSHRIHTVDPSQSDVVLRDYKSSEHYNSLQIRRRAAVSVADPTSIGTTLEDSSEFTKGLSTEEIARLNQKSEHLHSPSERAGLFSFHKKHLKLPFRHKGKKDKDKLLSPEKEVRSFTPTRHRKLSSHSFKSTAIKKNNAADSLLAHNFKQTTGTRFSIHPCEVCHKGFTGFMKHALKCVDCELMVHRHCDERAPPCKAKIASGSYVTMSRKKVVKKLEDLDELGRFLLDKIAMLSRNSSPGSVIDKVFKLSLMEFHTSLITSYSLSLQNSGEGPPPDQEDISTNLKAAITFSQLVNNFSNIFKGIAKREGLSDQCTISIGINQIKTMLDEFGKARRFKRTYSTTNIKPADLMRKTKSGKDIQPKVHKGHKFFPQQFKVATVCEFCSRSIGLLENGEVCEVCGYTCHESCFKKTHKKCEGKSRSKPIPQYNPCPKIESTQFGRPLEDLVPPNTVKVPPILETCFSYLEANGLYTQGVYRKSAGISSKKAVRSALEEDPENAKLDNYSIHAVASAIGGFFREMPEPLLTRDLYWEFIRSMDLSSKKEKMETLHQLISRLPPINHIILERLIFHLARFAQHEHTNKMSPNNLAIIFAPCLLQGPPGRSPDEIFKDLEKQTLCLETIIREQLEKLTATIRDIRTLDIYVRNTTSKLSKLIDQFEIESDKSPPPTETEPKKKGPPTPSKPAKPVVDVPKDDEQRKQLTEELEVLERERATLTVNLSKLEPFFNGASSEDELDVTTGDSEQWHSPSPPASSTRREREISPISETTEPRASWTLDLTSDSEERQSRETTPLSPPLTPGSPTIVIGDDGLPTFPTGPVLTHLTKNRVSRNSRRRPPSIKTRRKSSQENSTPMTPLATESHTSQPISPLAMEVHLPSELSQSAEYWDDLILKETTV